MKKSIPALLLISSFLSCTNTPNPKQVKTDQITAKKTEILSDLNNTKSVLEYLYPSSKFDTENRILWLPNETDQLDYPEIPVSYDSITHTGIDTILYFNNSNGTESAAVILANPRLEKDKGKVIITGSHFEGLSIGVALFSKHDSQWKLYAFKKHLLSFGYFGEYRTGRKDQGKITLKQLGENWTALSFIRGIGGNTGEFWGTETWFSIEQDQPQFVQKEEPDEINLRNYSPLNQLFSYNYHHNYYFPDLENQNSIDIKVSAVKTKSPVYDLKLEILKSNDQVETNKTNSSRKELKYYRYSPELNLFIEK